MKKNKKDYTYRVYGFNKKEGWELIDIKQDKEEAIKEAKELDAKDYYSYLVIEHDIKNRSDFPIERGDLYKECKVTFVDDLKTGIEVRAMTFKPSRTKRKQEDRRFFKAYFEGRDNDFGEDDYLNY